MIIQLILLLVLVAVAFFLEEEKAMLLVLMLLPFNFLLKSVLYPIIGNGNVFGVWKEAMLGVIFLKIVYKLFTKKISLNKYFPKWSIAVFFVGLCFLFVRAPIKSDAIISLKSLGYSLVVFFIFAHTPIRFLSNRKISEGIGISALAVFFIAHIEQFFLTRQFAELYHVFKEQLPNGRLLYTESAYTILARNRMFGPMVGPNELGMYTSLVLVYFSYLFFTQKHDLRSRIFLLAILILGISTLIQTYSRASWAIFLMSSFFVFVVGVRKWRPILRFGVYVIVSVAVMVAINKDLRIIFMGSVTGQEASAGARVETFAQSGEKIYNKPLGYGLGTIQYSTHNTRSFNTEIFWWLVAGELGIVFGIILILIYLISSFNIFHYWQRAMYTNAFTSVMPFYLFTVVVAGWASVIVFDPTFQEYLWSFSGLAINPLLTKSDYEL
ncbi:MAG: hypothetical protein DI598_05480 [Pseudopedobacter saltans]|uniref:O-antigen polymerase n=1 Tax=Pseudopedobacter saltans TaxID=151895 RepID=A0A2W5F4Y9_9SPHI|nr:MAG: hypothetical protein DI598_05480 [Pseudopedobacter saltans]